MNAHGNGAADKTKYREKPEFANIQTVFGNAGGVAGEIEIATDNIEDTKSSTG